MTTSESKGRFFTKRIDSHNESIRIDSKRELECSRINHLLLSNLSTGLICVLVRSTLRTVVATSQAAG